MEPKYYTEIEVGSSGPSTIIFKKDTTEIEIPAMFELVLTYCRLKGQTIVINKDTARKLYKDLGEYFGKDAS